MNLELATRNYLGGPLDSSLIAENVKEAIRKTSVPLNVSRLSLNDVDVYHGVEVDEFIVTECRNIGVWSGKRADNSKVSKARDRCVLMWLVELSILTVILKLCNGLQFTLLNHYENMIHWMETLVWKSYLMNKFIKWWAKCSFGLDLPTSAGTSVPCEVIFIH